MKYLLLLLFTAPVFAQSIPCDLTIKDFPAVRHLKLGMTETMVKAVLGTRYSDHSASDWQRVTGSPEIEDIRIDFLEGKVLSFSIYYDRSLKWNSALEFAETISQHLPLPKTSWKKIDRDYVSMSCRDFSVDVSTLQNKLDFNTDIDALTDQRTDWKRKAAFKP